MPPKTLNIIKKLWKNKIVRFLVCGAITAIFNVLLLVAIVKGLNLNTPFLRNLANVFSIEVSVFFSFFVYRVWVWPTKRASLKRALFRQISIYHLSVALSIASRSFIIFPILDWLGVHYVTNSLIGIVLGSAINYKISDKWVFKL